VIFREQGITQKSVQRKITTQAVKATMQEIGLFWHRRFLPEHFKPGAAAKYGYHTRQDKWKKRKLRETGKDVDLVFKGKMRDMMVSFARVSGSAKRVRIEMQGPEYVYYHNKGREATRITPAEEVELRRMAEEFFHFKVHEIIMDTRPETTKVG